MKHNFINSIILLFIIIASGCSDEQTGVSVRGIVISQGKPVSQVNVSIDDKFNLSTKTDENGAFFISGVTKGDHNLKMSKRYESGIGLLEENLKAYNEVEVKISVIENLVLDNLKLPKPVILSDNPEVTSTTAKIKWSSSDSDDFREYKVYRHTTSGLDEATGILVHVSTSQKDTLFMDSGLSPSQTYYYRVFVMNEFGKLGGSNLMSIETKSAVYITNGSFEILSDGVPSNWIIYPPMQITSDPTMASEGTKSIKYSPVSNGGCFDMIIRQILPKEVLKSGQEYKLSFKYKASFNKNDSGVMLSIGATTLGVLMNFQNINEWKNFETKFTLNFSETNDVYLIIDFCLMGVNENWWIDEVKMEKVM